MAITKQTILDDVQFYDANQLYQFILDGIVTLDELMNETEGHFSPKTRKQVEQLLGGGEDDEWALVLSRNTEEGYRHFIASHPQSFHCDEARSRILALQSTVSVSNADDEWYQVDKNSIEALQDYIARHPNSPHEMEARARINEILIGQIEVYDVPKLITEIQQIETDRMTLNKTDAIVDLIKKRISEGKVSRLDIVGMIRDDHNVLSSFVVAALIREGYLGYDELLSIGIKPVFLQKLARQQPLEVLPFVRPVVKINKVSTEIYFWGIPSSGKTCALGGILKVAGGGTIARAMRRDNNCQGYGYMTRLPQLFHFDDVCVLPEGTPVYATYEMGFDLEDQKYAIHPITCIDLAGELVRCMYKAGAGEPMSDDDELALDTLTRILMDNRTVNRKVHFFVVEYGGEKRKYEGLEQAAYLDAALRYIEQTRIFEKDTDAVFLIVTKVDMVGKHGAELQSALREYIMNTHYRGFYQGLQQICRMNDINGGEVEIMPFSLGEVCFQNYCIFDARASASVVSKILERSKGFSTNKTINAIRK